MYNNDKNDDQYSHEQNKIEHYITYVVTYQRVHLARDHTTRSQ